MICLWIHVAFYVVDVLLNVVQEENPLIAQRLSVGEEVCSDELLVGC